MSALPRPVATSTREAQLATLRAWHESAFGRAVELTGGPQSCPNHEYRREGCHVCEAFAGAGEIVVGALDSQIDPSSSPRNRGKEGPSMGSRDDSEKGTRLDAP